jgi:hypothetical protein
MPDQPSPDSDLTGDGQEWAQLSGATDALVKRLLQRNEELAKRVIELESELDVWKVRAFAQARAARARGCCCSLLPLLTFLHWRIGGATADEI